jgi:Dolichyl-phosphate-mannose-protein mannosyltransferase
VKWAGLLAFLIPLLVYSLTLGATSTDGVDSSIVGTQYAMWRYGTFSLGTPSNLTVGTVDYGVYNGHAYGATAPGMALLSYPFAAVSFAFSGAGSGPQRATFLSDEAFLALTSSMAVYFVYRIGRLFANEKASLLVALSAAFATPLWPFTTVVFPNGPALMFSTLAVYFVLLSTGKPSLRLLPLGAGLSLGASFFVEYAAGLFVFPLAVYLWRRNGRAKDAFVFVLAFLVGPLMHSVYSFTQFGNPLIFPEQLKSGTSQPVIGLLSSFNLASAPLHLIYYMVSPYRGILFLCPVLVLGLIAINRNSRARQMRAESLLFFSMFLLVLLYYSSWGDWAGGLAYGPRFLTIAAPYLLLPLLPFLGAMEPQWKKGAFLAVYAYSSFIQGAGALTTPFSVASGPLTFQPFALNLQWLAQGTLDTWWVLPNGLQGSLLATAFILEIFLTVWSFALILVVSKGD